ncbi:DUF393 domain-containing protein [Roseateles sp.]|uniref:thiol-disulfide oxidoreductase DCC family protein n=1 Tax=Roseateles sp. TaxID=1971397 RepID=UPI002DFF9C5F|nr:DUF393 domain-containing protein [Roseateles sp.]
MTATTAPAPQVHTVYYDGACPLCRGEIALLRQHNTAGRLEFVDIAAPGFDPAPLGVGLPAMLDRMHVRRPDGGWLVGIPAFQVMYAVTGFHGVARWLNRPWVARLAARAYPWIVRNRYRLPHTLVQAFFRLQQRSCRAEGACEWR